MSRRAWTAGWILLLAAVLLPAQSREEIRRLQEARQHLRDSRYAEAAALLKKVIEAEPQSAEAQALLGQAYFGLGDFAQARAALIHAVERGQLAPEVLSRLIQIDRQAGRNLSTLPALGWMGLLLPEDRLWQLLLAEALEQAGAVDQARGIYESILDRHPGDVAVLVRLGNLALRGQDERAAAVFFETAVRCGAEDPRLPERLADLWLRLGDAPAALGWHVRAAGDLKTALPQVRLKRARIHLAAGDLEEAAKIARPLMEADDPDTAVAAAGLLAHRAVRRGDAAEAGRLFEWLAGRGAATPEITAYLGGLAFNAADYARAAQYLGQRLDQGPEDRNLSRFLVLSLIRGGRHEEARRRLQNHIAFYGMSEEISALIREWAQMPTGR